MDAPKIKTYGNLRGDKAQSTMVYKTDGLAPTLCGSVHGSGLPYIITLGNLGGARLKAGLYTIKTILARLFAAEWIMETQCLLWW